MPPPVDQPIRPFEGLRPLASAESFSELFTQTHLIVYRYIFSLQGGPQETVEDLAAETYLRAWRSRTQFTGDEQAALRWLLRIARNLVFDHFRQGKRRPTTDISPLTDIASEKAGPEDQVLREEQAQILLNALSRLPHAQRELVVLRYILGWRVKDIADHLGILENTVSVNLRRSLRRMREEWPAG